jgi:hypothetical protein
MRRKLCGIYAALALLASGVETPSSTAYAEQRCESRPAVGGGAITTCREAGSGAPPQQYRTRQGVGGTSITTGGGRTCTTRPGVGGRMLTTCR